MAMLTFGELAAHFERALTEVRPLMLEAMEVVVKGVAEESRAYIGHELPEWAPLAESTVAEKTKLGYVGRISETDPLYRTGELRDSIEGEAEADLFGVAGVVGSSLKKALWMEMGTPKAPPRSYLGLAASRSYEVVDKAFGGLAVRLLMPGGSRR